MSKAADSTLVGDIFKAVIQSAKDVKNGADLDKTVDKRYVTISKKNHEYLKNYRN